MNLSAMVSVDDNAPEEEWLTPLDRCIEGQPKQRAWNCYSSADGRFSSGIWEAECGSWRVTYTEDEYCEILAGHSILRDVQGVECQLRPGDRFVIAAGFTGEWQVLETTRKVYVIYQS